jgi:hypothetical protein
MLLASARTSSGSTVLGRARVVVEETLARGRPSVHST